MINLAKWNNDQCPNCKQGYTREGYAAYPDHIELCRLHAAAPELLEACKTARKVSAELFAELGHKRACNWGIVNDGLIKLDKAIASAEGRA